MGWQTDLFTNITFSKQTFNSIYDVEEEIELTKSVIKRIKEELLSFSTMTDPKKFCPEDEDPITWILSTVKNHIDILEEEFIRLSNLELLKERWNDCHDENGLAIPPPNNISKAYLNGDFINTIKEKKNEV